MRLGFLGRLCLCVSGRSLGPLRSVGKSGGMTEFLQIQTIASFLNQVEPVGFHIVEDLLLPVRPFDLDGFGQSRFGESKIGSKIALREIAAAARNFPDLREAARLDANPGPHGVTIALGSYPFEVEEMVPGAAAIVQQQRRVVVVAYNQVYQAVVVEVSEGHAPPGVPCLKTVSGELGSFHELAIALVVKQRVDLLVAGLGCDLLDLGLNMSVRDEQIKPAVVVVVEKAAAKAQDIVGG